MQMPKGDRAVDCVIDLLIIALIMRTSESS